MYQGSIPFNLVLKGDVQKRNDVTLYNICHCSVVEPPRQPQRLTTCGLMDYS